MSWGRAGGGGAAGRASAGARTVGVEYLERQIHPEDAGDHLAEAEGGGGGGGDDVHLEQPVSRRVEAEGHELLGALDAISEHLELGDGRAHLLQVRLEDHLDLLVLALDERLEHCQVAASEVHGLHVLILVENTAKRLFERLGLNEELANRLLELANLLQLASAGDDLSAHHVASERLQRLL